RACRVSAEPSAVIQEDFGRVPDIRSFADLVRYAYGLERGELVGLDDPSLPQILLQEALPAELDPRFVPFISLTTPVPVIRHGACRAMLRAVLEQGYGLTMHREGDR